MSNPPSASTSAHTPLPPKNSCRQQVGFFFRSMPGRVEKYLMGGIFIAALLYNFLGITYHGSQGYLSGNGFRESQTALICYYIDRQDNFSLLYETPLLGKPWISILLEVPLYEWAVVGLSRLLDLPHVIAARSVSAACFYLTLPAVYLLLGHLRISPPRRLLVLALTLASPVYICYSRAFLIDPMALMGSVWFVYGFARTMTERRVRWLLLAIGAGTIGALVKNAIFAVWLLPAAVYGTWLLWQDIRVAKGWKQPLTTIAWGLATVLVPLGLLRGWVLYTDPIKAAHPSAWIFTSQNLTLGNWGLFNPKPIFSAETWKFWFGCWEQAVMPRWLIGAALLTGALLAGQRRLVLGAGALFFASQFLFPFAYAYQDYYYYGNALYLNAAIGFALLAILDSKLPRWLALPVLLVPFVAQVTTYWQGYRRLQSIVSSGDAPHTAALRELTPENSVIVVAGDDWLALTPYYSQRRALMIRRGLEHDPAYLRRAFLDLANEDVSAVVLFRELRTNRDFLHLAAIRFDLDLTQPTFSAHDLDVYVTRPYIRSVLAGLKQSERYSTLTAAPEPPRDSGSDELKAISAELAREMFAEVSPAPSQFRFRFDPGRQRRQNDSVILANPDADLWVEPAATATQIEWGFGIFPEAYQTPGHATDGVEFIITGEQPDGSFRRLYRRVLEPMAEPADRGDQRVVIAYRPVPGERLRFSTRPGGGSAYDWSYWTRIDVR